MKFHKFFSLKRFGRLMAADLQLNSKRYLYIFAGAAVALYLVFLLGMLFGSNNQYPVRDTSYMPVFGFSLIALGAFAGSAFPSFSEKPSTFNFLLFPASGFEKLLSQFLIYIVAGAGLFLFLFWADAHLARLSFSNLESVRTGKWIIEPFNYAMIFNNKNYSDGPFLERMMEWAVCFPIGCFLFTVRLFFSKFALVKSVISGIVLFMSSLCLMVLCSHLFYPDRAYGFNVVFDGYVFCGVHNVFWFFYSLCIIICLFFLPLAYFKLKEKQL